MDLSSAALRRACSDGLLESIDPSDLSDAKDGSAASDDFLPGVLHECGVPSVAWSSAIVFDRRAFPKEVPTTAKDYFDTKKFPGKRALPRQPKYTLELALMADGVEPDAVYEMLTTDAGLERALTMLDTIKDSILWWDRAHEPLKLLAEQKLR